MSSQMRTTRLAISILALATGISLPVETALAAPRQPATIHQGIPMMSPDLIEVRARGRSPWRCGGGSARCRAVVHRGGAVVRTARARPIAAAPLWSGRQRRSVAVRRTTGGRGGRADSGVRMGADRLLPLARRTARSLPVRSDRFRDCGYELSPGRAQRPRRGCAGTTPIRPARRASGTTAE